MAVIDIAIQFKRVVENLNESQGGGTYGVIDGERWKSGDITDAILGADGLTVEAMCSNRNHGRRKEYLTGTQAGITHGATLTSRIGPLESIQAVITGGQYAGTRIPTEASPDEIEHENRNPLALTLIAPHYYLQGDTLFHNAAGLIVGGASAASFNATFCTYARTSTCQANDEYFEAVLAGAMAVLQGRDGHHTEAAAKWSREFQAYLAQIRAGAQSVMREAA